MEQFVGLFNGFAEALTKVLPLSPFQPYISAFAELPYLAWLNWFIPVRAILVILGSWVASITVFYLYSIVMRWVKMIGG